MTSPRIIVQFDPTPWLPLILITCGGIVEKCQFPCPFSFFIDNFPCIFYIDFYIPSVKLRFFIQLSGDFQSLIQLQYHLMVLFPLRLFFFHIHILSWAHMFNYFITSGRIHLIYIVGPTFHWLRPPPQ